VNCGGKTHMRKLQTHQVPLVRQALQNHHRFKKLCRQIFEINTRLLLSKEA
jgi:hypothetical protein